jgi:hypothetical protein
LNIKKVDDKPMVIHTKEKTKLHINAGLLFSTLNDAPFFTLDGAVSA